MHPVMRACGLSPMFNARCRRPIKKVKKMIGMGYKKDPFPPATPTKRALTFRF